jgi:hypothetical protein
MLAEIEKIFAESSDYSAVFSPRQQLLIKLLLREALTDPSLTFFPFEFDFHLKVNPVCGIQIFCDGET